MNICCRICRRKELKDFFPLNYQSDFYGEAILSMINYMTGLKVAFGDKLPQQICRVCMGTLVAGYELRQLCIESDAYFRQAFHIDSQKQSKEDVLSSNQIDDNDLESCLTLGQIKLEPFVEAEETVNDLIETDSGCNGNGNSVKFFCCFPSCNVNYQFEELLIEHAASDHQLEKEANAIKCESELCCIVCARAFSDEVELLEHRNRNNTIVHQCPYCGYETNSKVLHEEHTRAHNRKEKVCDCGFRTNFSFSFKRHQTRCSPSKRTRPFRNQKLNAVHEHNIADDKTNDEIVAMGFRLNRHTTMFYCCISQCATVYETQQQLCDHFQLVHSEVLAENMENEYDPGYGHVFRCPICFLGFPEKKALQIHLEDAYAPTFRCNTCRYNCLSRRSAILHASIPCVGKMHRCSCGYATPYTYSIKRHMRVRGCPQDGSSLKYITTSRNKPNNPTRTKGCFRKHIYKCQYCEKSCGRPANLRRHMESELSLALAKQEIYDAGKQIEGSEQKQYTCRWCKTITDDAKHLVQCMVNADKNAGQDPEYKCTKCDKKFKIYNQYVEHTTNQACSQKSWSSCKHCGIKFPNKNKLVKHVANFHLKSDRFDKSKRYECKDCLQRFVTAYSLNRHRKNLHTEDKFNEDMPEAVDDK